MERRKCVSEKAIQQQKKQYNNRTSFIVHAVPLINQLDLGITDLFLFVA